MVDRAKTPPPRLLAAAVAWFELRLQLRSPVFWIVVAISVLMVVGSLTVERLRVGPLGAGVRTSAEAIVFIHLTWSLFFLFTAAAFAVEAVLRDERTGFGPMVRAAPAPARAVALGRVVGALLAVFVSFASVPLAAALAPFAPWLPPGALPPPDPRALLYGTLVLALPNLFLATALFAALAVRTRSALAAYLGAVALLVLYGIGSGGATTALEADPTAALLEPFGFAATRLATAGWSDVQRATALADIAGPIGWNRLVWLGVACSALGLGLRAAPAPLTPPTPTPTPTPTPPTQASRDRSPPFRSSASVQRFGPATALAQLAARVHLELRLILRSPFLLVLLLLGVASVLGALWPLASQTSPLAAIERVDAAFQLVPVVVATFWAGELVWSERERGLGELIGATPTPDWVFLAPKVLALGLVLAASLVSVALAAAFVEAARGGQAGAARWLLLYALPRAWDAALLAALAVFLQAVAPNKLAGFGLMVLYLIASLALDSAGLRNDLYRYGGTGATLAVANVGSQRALLVRAYWGAAAVLLLVIAHLLVGRGTETRLAPRVQRLFRHLRGMPGLLGGGAAIAWLALGAAVAGG